MIPQHIHIGPRTVKTAAAVVLSLIIVHFYGTTTSRMTFAMLGAMAAVEPTFTDSLRSCMAQIVGVFFGAVMGIVLMAIPMHTLLRILIGMVAVITLYNTFRISFSPSLPCLIVVTLFLTPDAAPMEYALGRIWDTAIGLTVGMLINTLIFPYDNTRRIRQTAEKPQRVSRKAVIHHFAPELGVGGVDRNVNRADMELDDPVNILSTFDLAGGVGRKAEQRVGFVHTAAVIADADQP